MAFVEREKDWEEITFRTSRRSPKKARNDAVWFVRAGGSPRPSRMCLARNLTDELCWSAGDRVQLYKVGTRLWALKPHKVGLITLKEASPKNPTLAFTNQAMALNFNFDDYGTIFDAWVDDEALYFKPAKAK